MIGSPGSPGANLATLFPGFNWNNGSEFSTNRDSFVNPLIDRIMGTNIGTQPLRANVYEELASFQAAGNRPDNLVDRLIAGGSDTRSIGKGVCAAMLGNAVTLVQ
jgi:hypothetical protein